MKEETIITIIIILSSIIFLFIGFATGVYFTVDAMTDAIVEFVDYSDINITINLDEEKMVDYAYLKAEKMKMLEDSLG